MKLLKVGEVAKQAGVSVRTLHHYDNMSLVKPSDASESGHRLYNH
jgi:DNA-binding transcriptional MerR regulator